MSPLRILFSLAITLCLSSCSFVFGGDDAIYKYHIQAEFRTHEQDNRMAEYLKRHLQRRSDKIVLDADGLKVTVHVGSDVAGDYSVNWYDDGGCRLAAKDERTMTWLVYQFIKKAGLSDPAITTDDLPPCVLPDKDTVVTFPFAYRDLYMPTNQNPDMTLMLGLNNLEMDWGMWGHNLARVLGSNGNRSFGFQNMDQDLFARSNGIVNQDQFCFSSEKLLNLTEQYIQDQYGDGSQVPYRMTIGPNDNDFVCLCRRCSMLGNTEGNATPAVVDFVERLARRFPNHTFFIPAYSTTQAFPSHRLPSNVGVFVSAIDYPRAWNDESERTQTFFRRLRSWKQFTDHIYVWDYICNFDDYLTPFPIISVIQQRLQRYRAEGVDGIFLNGSGYFYSMQQECFSFVLSALMLNPDLSVKKLVESYYQDAMPHVGPFYAQALLSLEDRVRKSGKELPLYGGIDDCLDSYLNEIRFRELYSVFLRARNMEMTYRERIIYEKTRQFVSYTFLEICRVHGLGAGGFAEQVGSEWAVKPEVWAAVEDLKTFTSEDDIYLLTDNENASMDHMDRLNENGVYVADYENEVELWMAGQWWKGDHLLLRPLKVTSSGFSEVTNKLTDGVAGISQNYHWGWQIYPQANLVIEIPADAVAEKSGEFYTAFLNFERHRLAPPESIEIWADDQQVGVMRREGLLDYLDEGEKIVFLGQASFSHPEKVQLRVKPSHTRNLALDEIYFR